MFDASDGMRGRLELDRERRSRWDRYSLNLLMPLFSTELPLLLLLYKGEIHSLFLLDDRLVELGVETGHDGGSGREWVEEGCTTGSKTYRPR